MYIEKTTTEIVTQNEFTTDWQQHFDTVKAVKAVAAHVASLPSAKTPERHTMKVYESGLRYYLAWAAGESDHNEYPITYYASLPQPLPSEDVIQTYMAHLSARGLAFRTINAKYMVPVRAWMRKLRRQYIQATGTTRERVEDYRLAIGNALEMKLLKPDTTSSRGALYQYGTRLPLRAVNDIFAAYPGDDLTSARNLALFYVGFNTGLRASELARITLNAIEEGTNGVYQITVRGKRNNYDPVAIDAKGVQLISRFVGLFNAHLDDGDRRRITPGCPVWQPLLKNNTIPAIGWNKYYTGDDGSLLEHDGLKRSAILAIVRRESERVLGTSIGAHDMRRTCASTLIEANVPIDLVSWQLRHKSVGTTAIYIGERRDMSGALLSSKVQLEVPV